MPIKTINVGVIGCGLMGREFASAAARWLHLSNPRTGQGLPFRPRITAVCDLNPDLMNWFTENLDTVTLASSDYHDLLNDASLDAIYCAVPHNLHAPFYTDIIAAGKHLLGEKPFGIDKAANATINAAIAAHPDVFVACSSEFPFYPGPYQIMEYIRQGRFGQIIEVQAHFWHASDLNPDKPINWKRMIAMNGEYGCMGDLGMHVCHIPFRSGWRPQSVRALLSNIVTERPDGKGSLVPCETWDNAILATDVLTGDGQSFPMVLSTKRIAPGHMNTWLLEVYGTEFSVAYSTKQPKTLRTMAYSPGGDQTWEHHDLGYASAYPAITGGIFEFGFPDSMLQMWAAFCDELANGRDGMRQPVYCATPQEAALTHDLFTAALESQKTGQTVRL